MRDLEFLTGHVTFKLRYNQIYQLKTTKQEDNNKSAGNRITESVKSCNLHQKGTMLVLKSLKR